MPVFEFEGHELYYELHGREGDPVLTIVNGLSMRTSHWGPYFQLLPQAGVRVLSYDMLGQGNSSKPVLGASFADHAAGLHALHAHLGIRRPYVFGISFGGVVALRYAVDYPEALGGLIPVSTFSELDAQLRGHSTNLYVGLVRVGFGFYLDLLMPLNFSNAYIARHQELIRLIRRVGVSTNELYGIQNLMESLADFESMTPELDEITAPTLIMNGEFDYLTPRHLHEVLRRNIRNSRLVLVPRVCHAFTLEIPELTSRLIAGFIHQVEQDEWCGDQSVWISAEDAGAEPLLSPCPGDHLRAIPLPAPSKRGQKPRRSRKAGANRATTRSGSATN